MKTDCSCVVTFCPQQFHPLGPGVGFPHLGAWRARVSLLSHYPDHVQWCSQCRRWKPPLFRSQKGWPACPAPAGRLELHAVLVRTAHRMVTLHPELAWGLGWVVTELLLGSDLLVPLGSIGWEGGNNYKALFLLFQRLEMKTRKKKKGRERNRVGSKPNQLTHFSSFCQGTLKSLFPASYLQAQLAEFLSGHCETPAFSPNYAAAFRCPWSH